MILAVISIFSNFLLLCRMLLHSLQHHFSWRKSSLSCPWWHFWLVYWCYLCISHYKSVKHFTLSFISHLCRTCISSLYQTPLLAVSYYMVLKTFCIECYFSNRVDRLSMSFTLTHWMSHGFVLVGIVFNQDNKCMGSEEEENLHLHCGSKSDLIITASDRCCEFHALCKVEMCANPIRHLVWYAWLIVLLILLPAWSIIPIGNDTGEGTTNEPIATVAETVPTYPQQGDSMGPYPPGNPPPPGPYPPQGSDPYPPQPGPMPYPSAPGDSPYPPQPGLPPYPPQPEGKSLV